MWRDNRCSNSFLVIILYIVLYSVPELVAHELHSVLGVFFLWGTNWTKTGYHRLLICEVQEDGLLCDFSQSDFAWGGFCGFWGFWGG